MALEGYVVLVSRDTEFLVFQLIWDPLRMFLFVGYDDLIDPLNVLQSDNLILTLSSSCQY